MLPVLFTIGEFNVYAFGFFLALAFVLSTFIVFHYAKEELKEEEYLDAFLYTSFVFLFFARVVYIFFHFESFKLNFLRYILVRETPGLSLLGGLVFSTFFLFWYTKKRKFSFGHVADIFSQAGSFALALTKIGEQLGGASFGKPTDFFWGVHIVGKTGKFHPVELYEAWLFFLLTGVLFWIYKKFGKKEEGLVGLFFIFAVSFISFLLEFLKVYPLYLGQLSFRQLIYLLLMLGAIFPLIKKIKVLRSEKK